MCVNILMPDGKEVETIGDALATFDPVIFQEDGYLEKSRVEERDPELNPHGFKTEEMCLCGLDVEATAEANGYDCEREITWFECIFTRKEAQP